MVKYIGILVFLLSGVACYNRNPPPSLLSGHVKSVGNYNTSSSEEGKWQYFDKYNRQVIAEGFFKNGVRVGQWYYYAADTTSIDWNEYRNRKLSLRTNIPGFLRVQEQQEGLVKFRHRDTAVFFNLAIGNGLPDSTLTLKEYVRTLYRNLAVERAIIRDTVNRFIILRDKKSVWYHQVQFRDTAGRTSLIYYLLARSNTSKPIEVMLRCDKRHKRLAKQVFFSLIPNLYIRDQKLLPWEEAIKQMEKADRTVSL